MKKVFFIKFKQKEIKFTKKILKIIYKSYLSFKIYKN